MARRPEGWTLSRDARTGVWFARFRHDGRQFSRSTRETDRGEALTVAARIHAEVASGARRVGVARREPLARLTSEWLTSLESSRSHETIEAYEGYVTAHWGRSWAGVERMTDASLADYMRGRLRLVTASTVRKELSALRGFLAWCVERGVLLASPVVPSVPRRAIGTPSKPQTRVDLTPEQVEAILAHLPETSRRSKGALAARHVRELYVVAWETGLRVGTLRRVEVPRHYRPGSATLTITSDIDKARWARSVPLSPRARATLDAVASDGLVFGAVRGRDALKIAARAAGVPQADRVSDHDVRHAAITHLASLPGASIAGIAYLVGHTHAGTTSRYVHAGSAAAEAALAARIASIVSPIVPPSDSRLVDGSAPSTNPPIK